MEVTGFRLDCGSGEQSGTGSHLGRQGVPRASSGLVLTSGTTVCPHATPLPLLFRTSPRGSQHWTTYMVYPSLHPGSRMKPIDSGDMGGCPAPEGKVKGLGILTIWELRHTWLRLQETQQTHPEMHVHTDRHTHTQGKYPPCPLQTDMQSHIRAVPSSTQHTCSGWAHSE